MFPETSLSDGSKGFSAEQFKMVERHPCLASDLIRKIPRMNKIAHTILYQEKCFNGEGVPHDGIKGEEIPYGARMLKVVLDFLRFKNDGSTINQASMKLTEQSQFYDPNILTAFKESIGASAEPTQQVVTLAELTDGMTVQEDVFTGAGLLVISKGQEISEPLRRIITHCAENGAISSNTSFTVCKEP